MKSIKFNLFLLLFLFKLSNGQVLDLTSSTRFILSQDSLIGFDENAARKSILSEQFYGSEFKIKMFQLKREYIDNKYNLTRRRLSNIDYLTTYKSAAISGCVNEDFEASSPGVITSTNQIAGWTISGGYNTSIGAASTATYANGVAYTTYYPGGISGVTSCNLIGCCPMPPYHSELIDCSAPGGYIDNQIGPQYPIYSVFGGGVANAAAVSINPQIIGGMFGSKVLLINDGVTGDFSMQKLSKTFAVTSSNTYFQFAFISVFAPGHGCCDAGAFQIKLTNASANTVIVCPSFSISAPSTACTATVPVNYLNVGTGTTYNPVVNFGNIYNPWSVSSIDLTPYIGQSITVDIIVSDCTAGGHYGKVYFDSQCGTKGTTSVLSPTLFVNGTAIANSDSIIQAASCVDMATLSISPNYNCQWLGAAGWSSTAMPLVINTPGTYSLMIPQLDPCITHIPDKIVKLNFYQSIAVTPSVSSICTGDSYALTVTGKNGFKWSNGDTTATSIIQASVTSNFSVTSTDSIGCTQSMQFTINVNECTGIRDVSAFTGQIELFPNPNKGEFVINAKIGLNSAVLEIENLLGLKVLTQAISVGENKIQSKLYGPAIYYYKVISNGRILTRGKINIE